MMAHVDVGMMLRVETAAQCLTVARAAEQSGQHSVTM